MTSLTATPTAEPTPLTVLMHPGIDDISDFFPFEDLASLSPGQSSTDPAAQDAFSFRGLIESGIDGDQEILLLASGCRLQDGTKDCYAACNDTSLFFGSLETFYNCAALASISYWTQDSMVYYINDEAEKNASTILGSGTLAGFDDKPVLDKFVDCAQESCRSDGLSVPCDDSLRVLTKNSSAKEVFDAMGTFCPSIEAEINPDIFGPGVLISYALQVSFATMLYLAVKLFTLYVRLTQAPKRRIPQPYTLTRIRTIIWPDQSALSRTSVAIATTLVEFQEAQCWFVFAVQIASILAIVVNSQEGTFWGEILVNAAVAFHVSQNGILPMFLIQICLHNEGIRNTHTFVGFLIEYILAIVAASQKVYFKDVFGMFRGQAQMEACGGNPSPRTYCAAIGAVDGLQLNFFPHPLLYKMAFLVLDTIAIIVLVVDQVAWTLRTHHRTKNVSFGRFRPGRFPETSWKPRWINFKRWFWWVLEIVYVVVNILYMVSLIRVITIDSFATNRWSYGQIIAMTVWGPVIVKLFDLIISGPQKNGMSMNSGPPRLRVDNTINLRLGANSMDESFAWSQSAPL
ncbi:uncharacterized protein F5Z01DRAFT_298788 [Emericellopsis atlantica]|uniref:Uncharacterized protein n=1 Tax=Emericellopsis atlantica TaxID=2614577 RepID=A0A9P8CL29_9HYPO|nr:uncharacterized protein F5Z01DRAFT_298788 [Emericellopsis atlantica]KAG9251189.1 hypothetical protein F5Z01DRAFT_298788 [Emericellopsis atlantica]